MALPTTPVQPPPRRAHVANSLKEILCMEPSLSGQAERPSRGASPPIPNLAVLLPPYCSIARNSLASGVGLGNGRGRPRPPRPPPRPAPTPRRFLLGGPAPPPAPPRRVSQ